MSTYKEEDKRIGYWKLETVPDHIDRIRRRGPHRMRMRRDKKKERQEDRRRDERK